MVLTTSQAWLLEVRVVGLPDGGLEPLPAGVADGHVGEGVVPVVGDETVG
jgi:hypothetical protein